MEFASPLSASLPKALKEWKQEFHGLLDPVAGRAELNALGQPPVGRQDLSGNPSGGAYACWGAWLPVDERRRSRNYNPRFKMRRYIGLGSPEPGEKRPVSGVHDAKSFPGYDEEYGKPLKMLMAMVGLVLLIALSNVVMLLIARTQPATRILVPPGAGRWPPGVLSAIVNREPSSCCAGRRIGLPVCHFGDEIAGRGPDRVEPRARSNRALFTLGILVLAALLFGLAPLRSYCRRTGIGVEDLSGPRILTPVNRARQDHRRTANGSVRGAAGRRRAADSHVAQSSEHSARNARRQVSSSSASIPRTTFSPRRLRVLWELMRKLRVLPGVESVTVMEERLGSWWSNNSHMMVDGNSPESKRRVRVRSNVVGPDFFHTLGVPCSRAAISPTPTPRLHPMWHRQ